MPKSWNVFSLLILFSIFLSGCSFIAGGKGSSASKDRSAHGRPTDAGEGVPNYFIKPTQLRPRCTFEEVDSKNFEVDCKAFILNPQNNEIALGEIPPNLQIQWKDPMRLEGAALEIASCSTYQTGLSQRCSIRLGEGVGATVGFDLWAEDKSTSESATSTEKVRLPYQVESSGLIPQIALELAVGAGFQAKKLDPRSTYLSGLADVCSRGSDTYFVSESSIYVVHDGKMQIYMGSTKEGQLNEFSHRLRTRIGGWPVRERISIACTKDALYVADYENHRILKTTDAGPVELIAGGKGKSVSIDGVLAADSPVYAPTSIAVMKNGEIAFHEVGAGAIKKIGLDGRMKTIRKLGLISFALGLDGKLYGAIEESGVYSVITFDEKNYQILIGGLKWVNDIAVNEKGTIYFSEFDRSTPEDTTTISFINKFDLSTGKITRMNGRPKTDCSQVSQYGCLYNAVGFDLQSDGSMKFANVGDQMVLRMMPDGKLTWIAGSTGANSMNEGKGSEIPLYHLTDISYDLDGGILTAEAMVGRLRKISPNAESGGYITSIKKGLSYPTSIISDRKGGYYFTDGKKFQIFHITYANGVQNTEAIAGTGLATPIKEGLTPLETNLCSPGSLTLGKDGSSLLFTEYCRSTIRRLFQNASGKWELKTILDMNAGRTSPISYKINGLVQAPNGDIFFTSGRDSGSVFRLKATGGLDLIAGWGTIKAPDSDNGPALKAYLDSPVSLALLSDGKLIFAEGGRGRLRVLKPTGLPSRPVYTIHTLFGGEDMKDCGSQVKIRDSAEKKDLESKIRASVASLCISNPRAVAVRENCTAGSGEIEISFSQGFQYHGNVVRVKRPCEGLLNQ